MFKMILIRATKNRKKYIFILILVLSIAGNGYTFAQQDTSEIVDVEGSLITIDNHVGPDSIRITADPGKFIWNKFYYESEIRFTALYNTHEQPDSILVLIDTEPASATFWTKNKKGNFIRSDYIILYKNEVQSKGLLRWRFASDVKVIARSGNIKVNGGVPGYIPVILLIIACLGGLTGGWIRRVRNSESIVDLPLHIFPERWSSWLVPLRESIISIIAGLLLYLLNMISPLYLEFRQGDPASWLVLIQPLMLGFFGGWGGINLLVSFLNQVFKRANNEDNNGD